MRGVLRSIGRGLGYTFGGAVVITIGWNAWRWVTGQDEESLVDAQRVFQLSWGMVQSNREVVQRLGTPLTLHSDPSVPPSYAYPHLHSLRTYTPRCSRA